MALGVALAFGAGGHRMVFAMADLQSLPPKIQRVPVRHWDQPLHFIASGGRRGVVGDAQAQVLADMVRARGQRNVRMWWARRKRRCVAAAMVLDNPGRTGLVLFSPVAEPEVDPAALAEVIRSVSIASLDAGLSLVQAFVKPDQQDTVSVLGAGGYRLLAELVYMKLDLADHRPAPDRRQLQWRTHGEFDDAELAALIEATYAGSLDCPDLLGVRDMADVLASHRSSGIFRPDSWWIVHQDGEAAGCVLVNPTLDSAVWDVVYLGVLPEFRGRGLAAAMLGFAAHQVVREGASSLTLAVDSENKYALGAYEQVGFRETRRRLAYVTMGARRREA